MVRLIWGVILLLSAFGGFVAGVGFAIDGEVSRGLFDCALAAFLFIMGVDRVRSSGRGQ